MEKIFGVLVTYNPDLVNLKRNIESIISQVDRLILFDNNSVNKEAIRELQDSLGFEVIFSPKNVGLSKAYNDSIFPYLDQSEFFVTFDQDTLIPQNAIQSLLSLIEKDSTIGVIGPVFSREDAFVSTQGVVDYVPVIIQSCAIFRSSAIRRIGGFNEDYFIDSVDFEYCLRLLDNQYKVAIYNGVSIKHELGTPKKFFGIEYYAHNKLRNYYIARNHVDLSKNFFKRHPVFILKKNVSFLIHFCKLVIFEKDSEKVKYFLKGIKNQAL